MTPDIWSAGDSPVPRDRKQKAGCLGRRKGDGELVLNGCGLSKVLEMGGGNPGMLNATGLYLKMVTFLLCLFYHNKSKYVLTVEHLENFFLFVFKSFIIPVLSGHLFWPVYTLYTFWILLIQFCPFNIISCIFPRAIQNPGNVFISCMVFHHYLLNHCHIFRWIFQHYR